MKSKKISIQYIVLNNADLGQQLECYKFLKEFYGKSFYNYSDLKTIVDEISPYIYVELSTKRIKRCDKGSFTPSQDFYVLNMKDFKKEFKDRVQAPIVIKVGTYEAVVDSHRMVRVGCQNISFKEVEEVYNTMLNFK